MGRAPEQGDFEMLPAPLPDKAGDRRLSPPARAFSSSALLVGMIACVLATALLLAASGGVIAGQRERSIHATQTTVADLDLQFRLGLADMEQGRYELAAQRFRWILARAPDYPGAADWLGVAERMLTQAYTPAPTAVIPTSSAETLDERFAEAQAYFNNEQWEPAIARLQEIQALDPRYREIEVKEMLYTALSTLGLIYVRGDRIEEGLLLLDQAEKIRPLDDQAAGERYLATLYVVGKTYWNLNWPVVIANFEAIYGIAPYYRDVATRLREAYVKYGDQLVAQGAPCDAEEQYRLALDLEWDSALADLANQAHEACLISPTPDMGAPLPTGAPDSTATPTPEAQPGGLPTGSG